MKKQFFLVLLLSISFALISCNFDDTSLSVPTNLQLNEGSLTWDAVDNNGGYIVKIGDAEVSVASNQCNLKTDFFTLSKGIYDVYVKAKGGLNYKDSDWSSPISYSLLKSNNDEGILNAGAQFTNENTNFVSTVRNSEPVAPSTGGTPPIIDSYYDEGDGHNYYLLDAGYVESVYLSTLAKADYTGVPLNFSKTTTTRAQITNTLTKSIQESHAFSTQDNLKIGIGFSEEGELGMPGLANAKFIATQEFSWTWITTNSSTNTKSTSNTTSTTNDFTEAQTVSYSFGANAAPFGFYRYAIYGTIDVYYILSTSSDNKTVYSWETVACTRENDFFVRSEYSENGVFVNTPSDEVVFDYNFYENLKKPTTTKKFIPPEDIVVNGGPYQITLKRENADNDNGWDTSKIEPNETWRSRHNNFEMGYLVLNNCAKNSDGTYSVATWSSISLSYFIEQDYMNLPKEQANISIKKIEDDNWNGLVKDIGYLNDKRIGTGAYYYKITYTDGTTGEGGGTDFFSNTTKNSSKPIIGIDQIDANKTVKSISFYLIYEVYTGAPGFLGIWWHEYSNWVCSTTITFK